MRCDYITPVMKQLLMSAAIDPQRGSAGMVSTVLELKFLPIQLMFDVMPDDDHFSHVDALRASFTDTLQRHPQLV